MILNFSWCKIVGRQLSFFVSFKTEVYSDTLPVSSNIPLGSPERAFDWRFCNLETCHNDAIDHGKVIVFNFWNCNQDKFTSTLFISSLRCRKVFWKKRFCRGKLENFRTADWTALSVPHRDRPRRIQNVWKTITRPHLALTFNVVVSAWGK